MSTKAEHCIHITAENWGIQNQIAAIMFLFLPKMDNSDTFAKKVKFKFWWEEQKIAVLLQQPFYGSLDFVQDYPGKPVPER